jgi:hypothetical protein
MSDIIRYEINYLSPRQKGMQRLKAHDHSDAAHRAVQLATDGCRDVIVRRFDPDTAWRVAGIVRVFDAGRPGQAPTVIYDDARGDQQRAEDVSQHETRTTARDHVDPPRAPRSGMRMFGAAINVRRRPQPARRATS